MALENAEATPTPCACIRVGSPRRQESKQWAARGWQEWQKNNKRKRERGGDDITNSPVFLQKKVGCSERTWQDKDIAAAGQKRENWDEGLAGEHENEFAAVTDAGGSY